MQLRNKYYPYPVIVEDGGYYEGSSFSTELFQEMDGYNIKISLVSDLKDDTLLDLVNQGTVAYAYHVECPQTCYRKVIKSHNNSIDFVLNDTDVNGIVQICSFLVAEKDIDKYTNESFAPEYKGFKFNIEKGCILAIGSQYNIRVNKIKDDLANTSSIFSIVPNKDNTESNILVDWGQQKIVVKLPEITYQQYYNVQNYVDIQPLMHSMVIIPALIYVFSELKTMDDFEGMEYYRWFRSLRKACEAINVILDGEGIKKIDCLKVSQQLLNSPIIKAVEYTAMGGGIHED